jgi:phosphate starvation-inducible PhoH-like protein
MSAEGPIPDTDAGRRVISLEDNRIASEIFGQFHQNLALLEQRLGIEAVAHGNHVTLIGTPSACGMAGQVIETLQERARAGRPVTLGDVDGALRLITARPEPRAANGEAARPRAEIATRRRVIAARTPTQETYIRALEEKELVLATGPAGTGKTYLAVVHAASMLERGMVDRIVLSRPAVEAGERLGFLPGDMREKIDPYLRPLYDALYDVMPADRVERDIVARVIEIAPLAFMRGRTLANAVVILDEAQNTTPMQMKMFLTRLGENGRMIVTGDPSQVDLPPGQRSGLAQAVELLKDVEGVAHVAFGQSDVVRHPLVQRIVTAYDAAERKAKREQGG